MGEFRAIVTTVVAGSSGMLAGAAIGVVVSGAIADAGLPLPIPPPMIVLVFVATGFTLGPWIALRSAGFHLAEVTTALAAVWVFLLILAAGPTLEATGPSWFPLALAVTALIIARTIAGPFAPYVAAAQQPPEYNPLEPAGG